MVESVNPVPGTRHDDVAGLWPGRAGRLGPEEIPEVMLVNL